MAVTRNLTGFYNEFWTEAVAASGAVAITTNIKADTLDISTLRAVQKARAIKLLRQQYYLKDSDPCIKVLLDTFEPEAVALAREVHDAQVAKITGESR